MGWATKHIDTLQQGQAVQFRPHGHSMSGKVESGELITVSPVTDELQIGDIVLCKVYGRQYLHLISAIQGDRYQISNNKGHVNGWVNRRAIYGICTKIEK